MPTYEYACKSCRKRYELRESFSAPSEHECQKCGKGVAKRVLHAPRVMFKGSGWYITDSKKTTTTTVDSDSSSDSESTAATKEPKAEKKPAKSKKSAADSSSSAEPAAT